MSNHFAYVIQSEIDGRCYKGMTANLEERIKAHNSGKNFSTRAYKPWKLVYVEEFESREDAREYKKFLKTGQGRDFIKKILSE